MLYRAPSRIEMFCGRLNGLLNVEFHLFLCDPFYRFIHNVEILRCRMCNFSEQKPMCRRNAAADALTVENARNSRGSVGWPGNFNISVFYFFNSF